MLDEFCEVTGYNRSYATRVLRGQSGGKAQKRKDKPRGRARKYGLELLEPIRHRWGRVPSQSSGPTRRLSS